MSEEHEHLYDAPSFEAFWRIYVSMHRKPATRRLHFVATTAAMACVAAGVRTGRARWLLAAPLVDYAIAQAAHRCVEENRTQPYRNPPWHLRAELRMWLLTLTGKMDEEVARCGGEAHQPARAAAATAPGALDSRGEREAQPTRVTAASTSTRPA